MPDKSVIQTTASAHERTKHATIGMCRQHMILISHTMPSEAEQAAFIRGMTEGWQLATFAILRDGNCRFERGE